MDILADFAEGEGFEPPIQLVVCLVSSEVLSTTQPSFRKTPYLCRVVGWDVSQHFRLTEVCCFQKI